PPPPTLPSFPTRRSSDLAPRELLTGAREPDLRVRRRCHGRGVMAGREADQGDHPAASHCSHGSFGGAGDGASALPNALIFSCARDRKSTRLNSSHVSISY